MLPKMAMEKIKCDFCENNTGKILYDMGKRIFSKKDFKIIYCNYCEILYTSPRLSGFEITKYYPDDFYSFQPFNFSSFLPESDSLKKKITTFIKKTVLAETHGYPLISRPNIFLPKVFYKVIGRIFQHQIGYFFPPYIKDGKVLDVGCGNGSYLAKLRELGWDVYGVEQNKKIGDWARQNLSLNIFSGDFESSKFPDNHFDVINFTHVFEHLPDLKVSLNEVQRVLKKGGLLIIDVPNVASVEQKIFGKYWSGWAPPLHLFHFSPSIIKKILNENGFEIIKIIYSADPRRVIASLPFFWNCITKNNNSKMQRFLDADKNIVLRLFLIPIGYFLSIIRQTSTIIVWARKI